MKNSQHMSHFGVGPVYVGLITLLTIIAILLNYFNFFHYGKVPFLKIPLIIIGIILIIVGFILWIGSVLKSKITRNITENKLVTTGVYACVRNPIYSSFMIVFTGVISLQNNLILYLFSIMYWILLSLIVRKEEMVLEKEFGKDYLEYKSRVNRCIPWVIK